MHDPMDLDLDLEEPAWRGNAMAAAGALMAVAAGLMVVLVVGVANAFPDVLPAYLLIGFVAAFFVSLGAFGVCLAFRGLSIATPRPAETMRLEKRRA